MCLSMSRGCSEYSYVHREAFAVLRAQMYKKRTIDSLGGPGLRDEWRIGRLEAVALQGPPARESDPGFRRADGVTGGGAPSRRHRNCIVDAAPHHVDLWSEMMVKLGLWKAPDPERALVSASGA